MNRPKGAPQRILPFVKATRSELLDADLFDKASYIFACDIVHFTFVFLFQAFFQIFGGDEAGFAVRQIACGALAEFYETGMVQTDNEGLAIDKKLGVNRVAMASGDAVPHVRETALIKLAGQLGDHFECAYKLAHRP